MYTFGHFTEAYYALLEDVYKRPQFVSAPRGLKIYETLGYQFKITDPRDRIPFFAARKFKPEYVAAEALWYFAGLNSTAWIANYSKFWNKISDDGATANSAYGARIFKPHDRIGGTVDPGWTQWKYVIDELVVDNDSRRAVIHIRSPQDSILAKKDVPCTISLQFFLRSDALHMVATMRSSDLIFGIGNDVPAFTLFQEAMALELSAALGRQIELGDYIHASHSLHIYEKDFKMVEAILSQKDARYDEAYHVSMPPMPHMPPVDAMLLIEEALQLATSSSEIDAVVETINLHDYYKDWCLLLASHRAEKIGEKDHALRLKLNTTYAGYYPLTV